MSHEVTHGCLCDQCAADRNHHLLELVNHVKEQVWATFGNALSWQQVDAEVEARIANLVKAVNYSYITREGEDA